jgi:hypothetical protein
MIFEPLRGSNSQEIIQVISIRANDKGRGTRGYASGTRVGALIAGILLFCVAEVFAQSPPTSYPRAVDLGVSGVFLSYRQSSEDVLKEQLVMTPEGSQREIIRCVSKDGRELLELTHYTGRWKNSFQQFRVVGKERHKALQSQELPPSSTPAADEKFAASERCRLPFEQFKSFRGIRLGMSLSEVTTLFGDQFKVDTQGSSTVIIYSIETNLASDFLRHYGALSYYARYYFLGGKLVEYSFGIDNL